MKIWNTIKNGFDKLYTWSKTGVLALKDWLVIKVPALGHMITSFTMLLLKMLKGSIYGCYYGLKDGYNNWKETEDYFYCTCINFGNIEEEPDEEPDEEL